MKYSLIISLLICCSFFSFSQKIDTIFSSKKEIKSITYYNDDSTTRIIEYDKNKIHSVRYFGKLNGYKVHMGPDTAYNDKGQVRVIAEYTNFIKADKHIFRSIWTVEKFTIRKNDSTTMIKYFKSSYEGPECPCGEWKFIEKKNTEVAKRSDCNDFKLDCLEYIKTEKSPEGKYQLEIYKELMDFAMPGQGSDAMATIILRDNQDKIIAQVSKGNSECSVMLRDVNIKWDLKRNIVSYALAREIDLRTGECY